MDVANIWGLCYERTGVNENDARMSTMQAIFLPVVEIEHRCSPGAILAEEADQLQERHDTHAIICCARGRRDRVKMGGKEHAIIFSWRYHNRI
jgi:hypothetical protein